MDTPRTIYVYGDAGSEMMEADSLETAVMLVRAGLTDAMLADGAWRVVRDEDTMESITIGEAP